MELLLIDFFFSVVVCTVTYFSDRADPAGNSSAVSKALSLASDLEKRVSMKLYTSKIFFSKIGGKSIEVRFLINGGKFKRY